MARKIEIFLAVDAIDMVESIFAIESRGGRDVAYNVVADHCIDARKLFIERVISAQRCTVGDSKHYPRRRDMIKPQLIETIEIH